MHPGPSLSIDGNQKALRLRAVMRDVAARRLSGERVADVEVIAAHPDLAPELSDQLRMMARVEQARFHAAGDASGQMPTEVKVGDTTLPAGASVGSAAGLPTRIGRYRILRMIGEGGMGTVYEAEQEKPQRIVALKVIRLGCVTPLLLRRFEQEAQVLGRLQHPGIAQIYEAGMADTGQGPQPYFAMELIKGQSVLGYAQTAGLGTRQRMELMAKVCDAVQHAHQKGVIHRDLKPGNILVTSEPEAQAPGQPKILDFGVARATDSDIQATTIQTDVGQLIGTIPYMSPEQVAADPNELDTRSDVYALGVVLYELLAGRLPYDLRKKMIHEAVRMIREDEPTPLSSINRVFRGDVETIVAKALEKDKTRRYQAASALAADIRRYLADEPIAARPPSATYQLRKFAKRNKALVGGVAAVFMVLVVGVIVSTAQYFRAESSRREAEAASRSALAERDAAERARTAEAQQRAEAQASRQRAVDETQRAEAEADRAKKERDRAQRISGFMEEMLKGVGPSVALGRDTTMLRELMDAAAKRITDADLKEAPEAELQLRLTIGDTYRQIGAFAPAYQMLDGGLDLARKTFGEQHERFADALSLRQPLLSDDGKVDAALEAATEASAIRQRLFKGDHTDVAGSLNAVAYCLESVGRSTEALPKYEAALAMRQRLFKGDHPEVALTLNNVAYCLESLGRLADALPIYEDALAMSQRLFKGDHPEVAQDLNNVASCLHSLGRLAEALPKSEAALAMRQRLFKGDHPVVASSLSNVASCLQLLGRPAEALPMHEAALAMMQGLFKGDHPDVANSLNNMASCLNSLGRPAEALSKYEATLTMRQRLFKGDHPDVANSLNNMAFCLQFLGRAADALPKFEEALAMWQRLFKGDHPKVATGLNNLALCLQSLGRSAEALPRFQAALDMRKRVLPPEHIDVRVSQVGLGAVLVDLNRYEEADPLLLEAAPALENKPGVPAMHRKRALEAMVKLYEAHHAAEPDKGYDTKAAEWRAKLSAWQVTTQPTSLPAETQQNAVNPALSQPVR